MVPRLRETRPHTAAQHLDICEKSSPERIAMFLGFMLRWIEHSLSFISRMALTHVEIDPELGVPALPPLRLVLQSTSIRGPIRKRRGRDRQRARRQQRHPRVVQLQGLFVLQSTVHFISVF